MCGSWLSGPPKEILYTPGYPGLPACLVSFWRRKRRHALQCGLGEFACSLFFFFSSSLQSLGFTYSNGPITEKIKWGTYWFSFIFGYLYKGFDYNQSRSGCQTWGAHFSGLILNFHTQAVHPLISSPKDTALLQWGHLNIQQPHGEGRFRRQRILSGILAF